MENYLVYEGRLIPESELMHHGIKGMKWGVRRYQNPDGSLTDAGKRRYKVGSDGKISNAKGATRFLNDSDISISRAKYEATVNYKSAAKKLNKAHKKAEKIAKKTGDDSILLYENAEQHPKLEKLLNSASEEMAASLEGSKYVKDGEAFCKIAAARFELAGYNVSSTAAKRLVNSNGITDTYVIGTKYKVKETDATKQNRKAKKLEAKAADTNKSVMDAPSSKQPAKVLDKPVVVSTKDIKDKVSNARKTGNYDMEFVERNLDQDNNGNNLSGKALDDAYEKYLKEKHHR